MKILAYVKITSFVTISIYAKNFRQLTRHLKVLSIENIVHIFKISSCDSQGKVSEDQIKEQRHSKFIVSGCLIYCCILRANHTPMIKWWMSECPEWLTLQITHLLPKKRASPCGSVIKNLPALSGDTEDTGSIPGLEDPLEKEMATHSSILAWGIPWTEEPGGLHSPWARNKLNKTGRLNTHTYLKKRWPWRWVFPSIGFVYS